MANLKRYTLPIVLAIIALALMVIGILSLTVWKPQQEVIAERSTDQPYTMTREGVLPLYADEVVVRASADGDQRVWLAVGSPQDVAAWLQGESYDEIVGLSTLTDLKATSHIVETPVDESQQSGETEEEVVEEDAEESESQKNPLASDMWTAVKYGTGSVSLVLSGDELDDSILAATDGEGPAPTISLTWETPQPNILSVIAFSLMGVFVLLAIISWAVLFAARSRRLARSLELQSMGDLQAAETTMMQTLPAAKAAETEGDKDSSTDVTEVVTEVEVEETPEPEPQEIVTDIETVPETAVEEVLVDEQVEPVDSQEDTAVAEEQTAPVTDFEPPEDLTVEEVSEAAPEEPEVTEVAEELEVTEVAEEEATKEVSEEEVVSEAPVEETVSTDSGMLNLAALQGGGAFPTRRALREARERGVDTLVVEGRSFTTRRPADVSAESSDDEGTPEDVLRKRSLSGLSWSELMNRSSAKREDRDN